MANFKMGLQCYQFFLLLTRSCEQVFQNEMIGERAVQLSVLELITSANQSGGKDPKKPMKTERR